MLRDKRILLLLAQLLAVWPVWRWYALRLADDWGECYGVLPLLLIWLAICGSSVSHDRPPGKLYLAAGAMLVYAVSYPYVPPLVRAMLAVTALTCTISSLWLRQYFNVNIWGLGLLALPLLPSLQFYLGYPFRLITAALSVLWLRMQGLGVVQAGTGLRWHGQTVEIDAPCSGLNMLWALLLLTFALGAMRRVSQQRMCLLALLALAIVIVANSLRSTALFYLEAKIIIAPEWCHAGVGMMVFGMAAVMVGLMFRHSP